jgi:hypothetical protein
MKFRFDSVFAALTIFPVYMLVLLLSAGCAGPRTTVLTDHHYSRLHQGEPVTVYLEKIDSPYEEIAFIESEAYPYIDDDVKLRQLDQLRDVARSLGANVIQEVRILPRNINGYIIDEAVPFTSWKQGECQLYFMRGKAVRVAEPDDLSRISTSRVWATDHLPIPGKIEDYGQAIRYPDPSDTAFQDLD